MMLDFPTGTGRGALHQHTRHGRPPPRRGCSPHAALHSLGLAHLTFRRRNAPERAAPSGQAIAQRRGHFTASISTRVSPKLDRSRSSANCSPGGTSAWFVPVSSASTHACAEVRNSFRTGESFPGSESASKSSSGPQSGHPGLHAAVPPIRLANPNAPTLPLLIEQLPPGFVVVLFLQADGRASM